jgi:hypothetical protein
MYEWMYVCTYEWIQPEIQLHLSRAAFRDFVSGYVIVVLPKAFAALEV